MVSIGQTCVRGNQADTLIDTREALHKKISTTFVNSWNNGIDADMQTFLSQFSPTVDWYDHAFFIRHKGLGGMASFRTSWLTSIKDFSADIESINVIEGGTVVRVVYHGTMVGKLPGRVPSGKTFHAKVLILLGINKEGKIQNVDEYYSALLDESTGVDSYHLMNARKKGSSKI